MLKTEFNNLYHKTEKQHELELKRLRGRVFTKIVIYLILLAITTVVIITVVDMFARVDPSVYMFAFIGVPFNIFILWFVMSAVYKKKYGETPNEEYVSYFKEHIAKTVIEGLFGGEFCDWSSASSLNEKLEKVGVKGNWRNGESLVDFSVTRYDSVSDIYALHHDDCDIYVLRMVRRGSKGRSYNYYGVFAVVNYRMGFFQEKNRNVSIAADGGELLILIQKCSVLDFDVFNMKKQLFQLCRYLNQINEIRGRIQKV